MPPIITKKSDIKIIANVLLERLPYLDQNDFWEILDEEVLQQKVRFPLLEYFAELLLEKIAEHENHWVKRSVGTATNLNLKNP